MEKRVKLDMGFDRISNLPDPIRAHILTFLPGKNAVRTSILSNSWRALWTQMPSLDLSSSKLPESLMDQYRFFSQPDDDVASREEKLIRLRGSFYDFLDRAFESVLMLERVKLCVPGFGSELKSRVDNWIDRALGYKMILEFEFELGIRSRDESRYSLPKCVFNSNLLTKLKLVNCEVNESSLSDVQLPSLCNLCLVDVFVNDEMMVNLIANCPNLEDFVFEFCNALERLEIMGLDKLKKARIKYNYETRLAIEIQAPSLLELNYECDNFYDNEGFCEIELYGCSNMKKFVAFRTAMDDMDLHSLLGNLPTLEHIELHHCDCLRYIEISSPNLIQLELIQCQWLRKAEVNAPNLKVFHYEDDEPIPLPLRGLTPRLNEATIYLKPDNKNDKYYALLVKFFAKFRHCEQLIICVGFEEDLKIPEKVRMKTRPPLSGVKHLMVSLRASFMKRTPVGFVESLLWLAPCLETISISNNHARILKSLELVYETPLKSQKKCGCWKSLPINCWRHSLNKVLIENKKRAEDDARLVHFFRNARIDGKMVDCSDKNSRSEPNKI